MYPTDRWVDLQIITILPQVIANQILESPQWPLTVPSLTTNFLKRFFFSFLKQSQCCLWTWREKPTIPMQNKMNMMSHGMSVQLRSSSGFQSRLLCQGDEKNRQYENWTLKSQTKPPKIWNGTILNVAHLCAATTAHPGKTRFATLSNTKLWRSWR